MTEIKYVDDNEKFDAGDFVSVTSAEYLLTNFAIVTSRGAYWTVVDLTDGTDYGRWDTVEKMKEPDSYGTDYNGNTFPYYGEYEHDRSVYKVKCYPVDKPVAIRHLSAD